MDDLFDNDDTQVYEEFNEQIAGKKKEDIFVKECRGTVVSIALGDRTVQKMIKNTKV